MATALALLESGAHDSPLTLEPGELDVTVRITRSHWVAILQGDRPAKWYEWQTALARVSHLWPQVVLELRGDGEDPDDHWRAYFRDGQVQVVAAEVIFKPFNPSLLGPPVSVSDVKPPFQLTENNLREEARAQVAAAIEEAILGLQAGHVYPEMEDMPDAAAAVAGYMEDWQHAISQGLIKVGTDDPGATIIFLRTRFDVAAAFNLEPEHLRQGKAWDALPAAEQDNLVAFWQNCCAKALEDSPMAAYLSDRLRSCSPGEGPGITG